MKCENVPKAVKKPPVLCTTPKTTFSRCRQMEDGGNYQFAHAQHEKFCQFNFRLPSCVDTVLNLKVSIAKETPLMPDTALCLRPDSSKHKLQINFCCLNAKYYIWLCRQKTFCPKLKDFLLYFKHIHEMEKIQLQLL